MSAYFTRANIGLSTDTLLDDGITHTHVEAHHSAGGYPLTVEDALWDIRSFYHYHVNGKGWRDIFYNVLVDPAGNVYEGRGAGNRSHGTAFTVCFLGNYEHDKPTLAQLRVLERYANQYGGVERLDTHRHRAAGTKYASLCPGINLIYQVQLLKSATSTRKAITMSEADRIIARIDQHFAGAVPPVEYEEGSIHYINRNRNAVEIQEDALLKAMFAIVKDLPLTTAAGIPDAASAQEIVSELITRLAVLAE